jgi:hypothetical protein
VPGESNLISSFRCAAPKSASNPAFTPLNPFDSSEFIFEVKHDGFRALALIGDGKCELVSRSRQFAHLAEWLGKHLHVKSAVIDGEIACLDDRGRTIFNDLLFVGNLCFSRSICFSLTAKIARASLATPKIDWPQEDWRSLR